MNNNLRFYITLYNAATCILYIRHKSVSSTNLNTALSTHALCMHACNGIEGVGKRSLHLSRQHKTDISDYCSPSPCALNLSCSCRPYPSEKVQLNICHAFHGSLLYVVQFLAHLPLSFARSSHAVEREAAQLCICGDSLLPIGPAVQCYAVWPYWLNDLIYILFIFCDI